MDIVGKGMIAQSLLHYREQFSDTVVFASGVANSQTLERDSYLREINLLENQISKCILENKRIVYFSSGGAVYGTHNGLRSESDPVKPTTLYGQHKLRCESLIMESGARYLILRLANLVGPSQNASQLVPSIVRQVFTGRVTIYTKATRDLLDVEDFASLLAKLLSLNVDNNLLNLASGQSVKSLLLLQEIQQILQTTVMVDYRDEGDRQEFDLSKLRQLLMDAPTFSNQYFRSVLRKYVVSEKSTF